MASSKLMSSLYLSGPMSFARFCVNPEAEYRPFFQERLRVHHVLPDRTCLPGPVRPRWIYLIEGRSTVDVPPRNEQRDAERPYTTINTVSFPPFNLKGKFGTDPE